jgi:NTE family protein
MTNIVPEIETRIALAFSGGNALGAFQAGAYEALHARGVQPDMIVGASIGAVNGALIAGNPAERQMDRLMTFWNPGRDLTADMPATDTARRTAAASLALATGHYRVFAPRTHLSPDWWDPRVSVPSLFSNAPLRTSLDELVDLRCLNEGPIRFAATAVDIETGEDVVFDRATPLTTDHVLASGGLMPAFPGVEIDGHLYGDAGMSANLPLDTILAAEQDGQQSSPLLCLAVDLLPLQAPRPTTLGEAIGRAQDLMFAAQSRRIIAAWQALFAAREQAGDPVPAITLVHISYADQSREVAGKAFDFSPGTVRQRWDSGRQAMELALDHLVNGRMPVGRPGLHVVGGTGEPLGWSMTPGRTR